MKTKSIYKTYTQLESSWRAGIPVSLARTGPRRFEIGDDTGKKKDFIYDVGFVQPRAEEQAVVHAGVEEPREQSSRRANLAALRRGRTARLTSPSVWIVKKLWPKFLRLPKPARYLVGAIVLAYLVLRIVRVVLAFSSLDTLGQTTAPQTYSAAAPVAGGISSTHQRPRAWSECLLALDKLAPVAQPIEAYGAGELLLVHDIIIGGERQQQVTFECGGTQQDYLVRFSKLDGTWKAKSATPLGSHSE